VLGGDLERERSEWSECKTLRHNSHTSSAAARLCGGRDTPTGELAGWPWTTATVVLSSAHGGAEERFLGAGVAESRLVVDESAFDTLSNFSRTLALMPARLGRARHVLCVTSAYHVPRARTLALLILGSRGVACTVLPLDHAGRSDAGAGESRLRALRDAARGVGWALSGLDAGEMVGRFWHPERFAAVDTARRHERRRVGGRFGLTLSSIRPRRSGPPAS